MNAVMFRRVLIAGIVVLIVGAVASFYLLSMLLAQTAQTTNHAKIDAELSRNNVERLKKLGIELKNKQEVVEKAQSIIAQSTTYQYQDEIVNDINTYASRAGVKVVGYDFKTPSGSSQNKAGQVSGAKKITATLSLAGPMEFEKVLVFLKAIEQNLTKMQITSVDISKDVKTPSLVDIPAIGLEIYVKN